MLSQLDTLNFTKWHLYMVGALGTTWIFDGFEVSMLSLVSDQLMVSFDKTESQIGLLASIYLIGCCTGALVFSCFAYKFGRKDLFNITLLVYACSVIAISFSTSYEFFAICRFFTGVGVGGEYTAIFAAIDELIPAYVRGRVDIIIDGTWAFGGILASITSLILYYTYNSTELWRIQFLIGGLGVLPILIMRRNIPESPRWLYFKGRQQEAQDVIKFIVYCCEQNVIISFDEYKIKLSEKSLESLSCNQQLLDQADFKNFLFQICYILFKKYPSRLFLGLVLMSVQAFFYQGIYYTFAMQLKTYYGASQQQMYIFMMPLTIAGFLGTLIFGKFFDTLGRRCMITFTCIIYQLIYQDMYSGVWLGLIGLLIISVKLNIITYVSLFFVLFVVASPGASAAHLTVSEIFPSEMRSQAMALFFATGLGVGGVISPYFFSKLIQTNSTESFAYGCFLGKSFYQIMKAAGLMIFAGLSACIFAVPAENKSLEEISNFGSKRNTQQTFPYLEENNEDKQPL